MRRLALLTAALFTVLGAVWAVASPPGSSPDDNFHLASIWCAWGDRADLCRTVSSDPLVAVVPHEIGALNDCESLAPGVREACAAEPTRPATWLNDGLYPPTYYAAMGSMASTNVTASTVAMRLVNVLLAAAVLLGAILLAPPRLARAFLLALTIGLVPLGLFLVASTNPSGWMITGAGGLWIFAGTWLTGTDQGRSRRIATATGMLGSAVLVTARGDGAVLALIVVAAALITHAPMRATLLRWRVWWPFAAVGAWSLLILATSSQVAVHSSGMKGVGSPSAGYEALPPSDGYTPLHLLVNNVLDFPRLIAAALGGTDEGLLDGLGWLDVRVPELAGFIMLTILGGSVLIGLSDVWRRKIAGAAVLALPLVVFPLAVLQRGGHAVGVDVQGRYLLPALIVFLAIWLSSRPQTPPWPQNRATAIALGLGLWVALATASLAVFSFYQWTAWAVLPPALLLAVGLVASAGFAFSVVATLQRQCELVMAHQPTDGAQRTAE